MGGISGCVIRGAGCVGERATEYATRNTNRAPHPKSRLIWAAIYANMGCHIMKTTIEIADDLFERAQHVARKEKTTFRSLTEEGLRLVLQRKAARSRKLPPLVTVRGSGLTDEFKSASWDEIRDAIYRGRGT